MNTEEFYRLPKQLALADGFISKVTGEAIKLTPSGKIIYAYMLTKNIFFTEKLDGQHYESQATIAKFCGLEYKAAGVLLRTFLEHGVLEGKKLRPEKGGQWRWHYYKVHTDLMLWQGTAKDFSLIEDQKPKYVEKTAPKPAVKQKSYQPPSPPDWDEQGLPF